MINNNDDSGDWIQPKIVPALISSFFLDETLEERKREKVKVA